MMLLPQGREPLQPMQISSVTFSAEHAITSVHLFRNSVHKKRRSQLCRARRNPPSGTRAFPAS